MNEPEKDPAELDALIDDIGIARFQGRITSGLIDTAEGAKAMQRLVERNEDKGMISKLAFLWRNK